MPHLSIATLMKLAPKMPTEHSIMLRGDHGVGKSSIVRQLAKLIAEQEGIPMPVVDVRISQMSDGDMIGLPTIADLGNGSKATKFHPPEWYMQCVNSPAVLFLDEFNRGTPEIMQACFQIVLDRCMNLVPLHPKTRVFAAINMASQYNVNSIDPALLDRLWVADLDPSANEWLEWARGEAQICPLIVDFIANQPVWLDPPKKSTIKEGAKGQAAYDPTEVTPSRRSWEQLDKAMKHMGLTNANKPEELDMLYALSASRVGTFATQSFVDFAKKQKRITGADIIDRYIQIVQTSGKGKKAVSTAVDNEDVRNDFLKVMTNVDQCNAVADSFVQEVANRKWDEVPAHVATNVKKFMADLPAEIFFATYKPIGKNHENIKLVAAINPVCGPRVAEILKNESVK